MTRQEEMKLLMRCLAGLTAQGIVADVAIRPDGTVELRMPEGSTPEQIAAGEAALATITANATIQEAKEAKAARLDAWFAAATAAGITVGGMTFDATPAAQSRLSDLASLMNMAKSYGYADDATEFPLSPRGQSLKLPAAVVAGILVQYGFAAAGISAADAVCRAAIANATTLEELDAIQLPG